MNVVLPLSLVKYCQCCGQSLKFICPTSNCDPLSERSDCVQSSQEKANLLLEEIIS